MSEEYKIVPLSVEHAERSFQLRQNPKLWEYALLDHAPTTLEDEREFFRMMIEDESVDMYSVVKNDVFVGYVKLHHICNGHAESSTVIMDTTEWNKGLSTLLNRHIVNVGFKKHNLDLMIMHVNPKNVAQRMVAINLGYYLSARALRAYNVYRYEITRTIWQKSMKS